MTTPCTTDPCAANLCTDCICNSAIEFACSQADFASTDQCKVFSLPLYASIGHRPQITPSPRHRFGGRGNTAFSKCNYQKTCTDVVIMDWEVIVPWCIKDPIEHWLQQGDCYYFRHYPDFDDKSVYYELLGRVSFDQNVDYNNDNGETNDITPIGFSIQGLGTHRFVSNKEPVAGSPEACRRANPPPVLNPIVPPANITQGVALAAPLQPTVTDPGDVITFTATGLPNGLSINSATGAITGTPTQSGQFTATVTATDSQGQASSQTFVLTVLNPPPVITAIPDRTDPSGTALVLQVVVTDPGDTLTYAATGLPPGLLLNTGTGLIQGTPGVAGVNNVTITVTDSANQVRTETFVWTIT